MQMALCLGAIFCFIGVMAGAIGSHVLKGVLLREGGTRIFELATDYMFYHGLALMTVGLLKDRFPNLSFQYALWFFVAGSLLFQGNLYLISLTGTRTFQMLAPAGGICLMMGWGTLIILAVKIVGNGSSRRL
jgi:uncharacterized membrane protein YgdD (TMEM256/DUF423 family)